LNPTEKAQANVTLKQTSLPRLRAGVVGLGVMGRNHARMLTTLSRVDLVGLVDADAETRKSASEQLGAPAFATVEELLTHGVDFAVVASPNDTHREIGVALLNGGAHVLMEKPIAPSVDDAKAIIAAAQANTRKLMVGHIERFNPAVIAAKNACAGQNIIAITIARVGPFPPRMSKIGVVIDLGVHDIDIIRMISGAEIHEVQALLSSVRAEREDNALLQFRTNTNVIAHINTNWTTPYKLRTLQIATEEKFIAADLMTRQVTEYSDYTTDGSFRMRPVPVITHDPLKVELESFVSAIVQDKEVPISGADGLANLEVALRCLEVGLRPGG
jgi:predicted dehydrogenase